MLDRRNRKSDAGVQPARSETSGANALGAEAMAFLLEQRLDPTPANYELAYAYRADRNSLTARAVDAIVMAGDRLDQKRADEIVTAHVRPPAPDDAEQRAAMRRQALQLSEIAAGAASATGKFNRELSENLGDLDRGVDVVAMVRAMAARSLEAEQALAAASRQIEELRQEVEAAKGDAARDALTGLHNRRGVEDEMRAMPARGTSSLVICDIDHFKSINDRYGHVVGDRVLKLVASSLAKSCAPHLVARWGGEEFIILVNGLSVPAAAALVDRARVELGERDVRLRATDQPMGRITFSAGVSPLNGRRFDDAVRDADALLYKAKAEGRDQVRI